MGKYINIDYRDVENQSWNISIYDIQYLGAINEVQGYGILRRPRVKIMDVLRGSSVTIKVLGTLENQYYRRLYEVVGDKKLRLELSKNGVIQWQGWIKADGIIESFVTDRWELEITAVDGLGFLKNTQFKKADGLIYRGSQSELSLLTRCLQLTGLDLNFRVYDFDLFYDTENSSASVPFNNLALLETFVNADRYKNNDEENSVFDAEKVLKALLKKYGAYVFQEDNIWHIQKVSTFFSSSNNIVYKTYNSEGVQQGIRTIFLKTKLLGNKINGFNPFHAKANQLKTYDASLGAYKVTYKYGFVASIINNSTVEWTDLTTINNWTYPNLGYFQNTLNDDGSVTSVILPQAGPITNQALLSDGTSVVAQNDILNISIDMTGIQSGLYLRISIQIKLVTDTTTWELNAAGVWVDDPPSTQIIVLNNQSNEASISNPTIQGYQFNVTTQTVPEDGELQIIFYRPRVTLSIDDPLPAGFNGVILDRVSINTNSTNALVKGISYTARNVINPVAKVDLTDEIYVGDNISDLYIGGIEDDNGENTIGWSSEQLIQAAIDAGLPSDSFDGLPLLYLLAYDRVRLSYGNSLEFKGGIYGVFKYNGKLTIDNVEGNFMTVEFRHDTRANTIDATHIRVFNDYIFPQDEIYIETNLESDNIVRPAIE